MANVQKLKLRPILFLLILFAGLVPLAISTLVLIKPNREILRTQEQTDLTRTAESLSRDVDEIISKARREMELIGRALLAAPGSALEAELLKEPWAVDFLQGFANEHSDWRVFAAVDKLGQGQQFATAELSPALLAEVGEAFNEASQGGEASYHFTAMGSAEEGAVVLAVPVADPATDRTLILEAVLQPQRLLRDLVLASQGVEGGEAFLIDRRGELIWTSTDSSDRVTALLGSDLVHSFRARPMPLTEIYDVVLEGKKRRMIAIVSPIEETGWGIVAARPESAAFLSVRRLLLTALVSSLSLVLLALLLALLASGWIGQPIQRLAQAAHAIAKGDFTSRVNTDGMRFELAELAEDFNVMGDTVESYVAQLQKAAKANRELFIGSLRAFTAAIDAKDPYTRGHSERVASLSRIIASHLGISGEMQSRLWIAALLHDVGKIGVDDRILKKGGVLSPEEYAMMQKHTVIGAEIIAPIEQLRECHPVVRWHHENWNGRGYPDGLKGEKIPLMARIVAVADTFDAITTNRPYQDAYTLEYAVETITKLTGTRFDAKVVTAFLKAVDRGQIQIAVEPEPETVELSTDFLASTGTS
ncbi:MAG: HD domain-containing protein [Deltaproteobacteria bacterium]|nr:HD domain-containing protein [Deltaproteobacteria bacterium]